MKKTLFRTLANYYFELAKENAPMSLLDSVWRLMKITAGNRPKKIIISEIKELIEKSYLNSDTILEIKAICSIINLKI